MISGSRRRPCERRATSTLATARVNDISAFILRMDQPEPCYRRGPPIPPPHTMFEVVGVSLLPGIEWGAEVTLEFDADPSQLQTLRV